VHIKKLFGAIVVSACALAAGTAQASTIAMASPLTGTSAAAPFVDLVVSFDPNGHEATNITGWELYVAFSGLSPIDSSFRLGSVVGPFAADVIELHGTCGDGAPCSDPPADPLSRGQWVSLASVFAPHLPAGPGTLFTLRFAVDRLAPGWTLDVFGESADAADACGASSALLWEHPVDGPCAIVPFLVVPAGSTVDDGIARVDVSAVAAVPEPSVLALLAAGFWMRLARRRAR
jgi:hypothetical protein